MTKTPFFQGAFCLHFERCKFFFELRPDYCCQRSIVSYITGCRKLGDKSLLINR